MPSRTRGEPARQAHMAWQSRLLLPAALVAIPIAGGLFVLGFAFLAVLTWISAAFIITSSLLRRMGEKVAVYGGALLSVAFGCLILTPVALALARPGEYYELSTAIVMVPAALFFFYVAWRGVRRRDAQHMDTGRAGSS